MISVIVPFHNEQESLKELIPSLCSTLDSTGRSFEIILVDDGSDDSSLSVARELLKAYPSLILVSLRRNRGKSAALAAGLEKAAGVQIITMDADTQDDPSDIPKFLEALGGGLDLVCGWRKPRRDSAAKRCQSFLYNLALKMAGFRVVHDINCGFRAMRGEVARDIPLYSERHRLMPLLASWHGFRVGEVVVNHRPRKHGKSKYGVSRFPDAIFDIFTALLLSRFYRYLFSVIGGLVALAGLAICAYITVLKVTTGSVQYRYPLLILGVMLLALGVQLVLASLLSELIVFRHGGSSPGYSIKFIEKSRSDIKQPPGEK